MSDFEVFDPIFNTYFLGNAPVEKIASGFRWVEGPAWMGDAGTLLFSDIPNNRIMRWIEGVGVSVYRAPSNYANGNTRDLEGRLVTCEHEGRRVTRTEHDGSITVIADGYQGKRLNSPNDVVVKSDGSIWFTDPHYGIMTNYEGYQAEQELPCYVYRADPNSGKLTVVADDFEGPNGLCFSPDESKLYIADSGKMFDTNAERHIRQFDVLPDGKSLKGGAVFAKVSPGFADGFRADSDGNIWSSSGEGVHCYSPEGKLLGKVLIPEVVANITFGGPRRNRLFICASTSVFSVFLNRQGAHFL